MARCRCLPGDPTCGGCGCLNNPDGPGHRVNGDPCGKKVVPGTHRCAQHGGTTPTSLIKAQLAMAMLRLPAIESLYAILETMTAIVHRFSEDPCPACGFPRGDVEEAARAATVAGKAAQTILDRTDMGPKATLEVKQTDGDLDLALLTDVERERMMSVLAEYHQVKEHIRARLSGNVPPTSIM